LLMYIGMTGYAFASGFIEYQGLMTASAIHPCMLSLKLKVCFIMIKCPVFPIPGGYFPAGRIMACCTINLQVGTMRILTEHTERIKGQYDYK